MIGMGAMLSALGGNRESVAAWTSAVGKRIAALELADDELRFTLADGSRVALYDDGQSCCESRHLDTDDDLKSFVGAELRGAEVRDAGETTEGEYGNVHEIQFLVVETSSGQFTVSAHNEHNGYYGGISIRAKALP